MYQKVTSSIPSQGTCLSCGPGPQLGACERQLINVSLSLFLPHPLSLKIIFKILKNKREKHGGQKGPLLLIAASYGSHLWEVGAILQQYVGGTRYPRTITFSNHTK